MQEDDGVITSNVNSSNIMMSPLIPPFFEANSSTGESYNIRMSVSSQSSEGQSFESVFVLKLFRNPSPPVFYIANAKGDLPGGSSSPPICQQSIFCQTDYSFKNIQKFSSLIGRRDHLQKQHVKCKL